MSSSPLSLYLLKFCKTMMQPALCLHVQYFYLFLLLM
ncbi:hypothetical protein MARI_02660 [Marinobacter sp. JH2]|nr:hypothetical protein MARI_02660 [Marinobacter sp. JH2]